MKKVLVILAVLAMTGISSAAMLNNPETFESYTSGTVLNGPEGDKTGGGGATWAGWGSGSGDGGWVGGGDWNYIIGSGDSAAVGVFVPAEANWWGYSLLFNHGNAITDLPGLGMGFSLALEFDVLSINVQGVVKIEYYDAAGNSLAVDAWDPVDLSALGHFSFLSNNMPTGTTHITPVIGVTGPGYALGVFDNIQLSFVPEPATLMLLGLGGLLIRRRK
jgi:hypothetical protein